MNQGPLVKGNPLRIAVYLLVPCYLIGEFIFPKYPLLYLFNLIGVIGLIISLILFFSGFNIFKSYEENPTPKSVTKKLIKTGIFAYTRNPIYISFLLFHFSMFLTFENVMYFITSIGLAIWIQNYVIKAEEEYLIKELSDEYQQYMNAVKRWGFF
jgi:protein-S-isoprenylcysteine O-methyltransferase Ste14